MSPKQRDKQVRDMHSWFSEYCREIATEMAMKSALRSSSWSLHQRGSAAAWSHYHWKALCVSDGKTKVTWHKLSHTFCLCVCICTHTHYIYIICTHTYCVYVYVYAHTHSICVGICTHTLCMCMWYSHIHAVICMYIHTHCICVCTCTYYHTLWIYV